MRRSLVLLLLLALLVLGQCGRASGKGPTPGVAKPGELGEHLLVEAAGSLSYKHAGWKDYLPLTFGIALSRGDLLKVAPDAEGLVVCADLSLAQLKPGYEGGLPCSDTKPVLMRGQSLVIAPQRSAPSGGPIPYLLGPRHTFIKDGSPVLRWAPTGGVGSSYTVRVRGGELDWQTSVSATELGYPKDAPALQAGVPYRVTVTDATGRSSDEEGTALDLSFVVLSAQQVAPVEALVRQAQGLNLSERATRLLEAEIHVSQGLRADAIALLVDLAARQDAPTLQQRLGDLYREIGLYAEAEKAYQAAFSAFQAVGDQAGEAGAMAGLGLAQRGDNDEAGARDSLTKSRDLYQGLGDTQDAGQVEQLLKDLGGK